MAISFPWPKKNSHRGDPYWDFFINTPPADFGNTVIEMIRKAPEGNIFPAKTELHTPEITSRHVKDLAEYLGAAATGIARLGAYEPHNPEGLPFAVLCAVRADYDPRNSPGIGGQVPVQNGLFITFVLSAWIRELGFQAAAAQRQDKEQLAVRARIGTLSTEGQIVARQIGAVYIADVIHTDLPLAADG